MSQVLNSNIFINYDDGKNAYQRNYLIQLLQIMQNRIKLTACCCALLQLDDELRKKIKLLVDSVCVKKKLIDELTDNEFTIFL